MVSFRTFALFALASLFLACNSSTGSSSAPLTVTTPVTSETNEERLAVWDVAPNPEAVAIGAGVIYASHFGPELKPMEQDGDGYIAEYDANGGLLRKLVIGLDAPKGVEVIDNQVFVVDVDSLLGFSTVDGSRTFSASFTGKAKFLNGLVAANDGSTLFVSATDAGKIWNVDLVSGDITEVVTVPNVNGLALSADGSVIYAVQYNGQDAASGRLLAVSPSDGAIVPLGSYAGLLDGVFEYKRAVYFTDWNPNGLGKVLKYDLKTQATTVVLEDARLQGPADFEVLGDGLALIPMLTGSSIIGVRFN